MNETKLTSMYELHKLELYSGTSQIFEKCKYEVVNFENDSGYIARLCIIENQFLS
jgi:hypothetical protein